MSEAPPTRPSLLVRLGNLQDHLAWGQFVDIYAPLIYGYARKRGLQDADAADLTQICLRQVATHVGSFEYDPKISSFRGWLFTIVRNKLSDFLTQLRRLPMSGGSAHVRRLLDNQPAPEADETAQWEREYQSGLFAWAMDQIRPSVQETTWQAFWQTAVQGKAGREVADRLGVTVASVYLAKSRIMAKLRVLVRDVQEED